MIRILTDSTCDLPPELIAENRITVLPLYINIAEQSYLDGVDMSRQQFYERLPHFPHHPTTAAPSITTFRNAYDQLFAEDASEILSIHISKSLSAVVDVAQLAAQEEERAVTVFDSDQLSLGAGYQVLTAAKAAAQGLPMTEIISILAEQTQHTYVFAALDTLEFLRRSGRMHFALATLGSLLRLKPILTMNRGNPKSLRTRTTEKAIKRLIELVTDLGPLERLDLVHTNAAHAAEELHQRAKHLFPAGQEPLSVDVTPVLGAHIGPGVVGFATIARA